VPFTWHYFGPEKLSFSDPQLAMVHGSCERTNIKRLRTYPGTQGPQTHFLYVLEDSILRLRAVCTHSNCDSRQHVDVWALNAVWADLT